MNVIGLEPARVSATIPMRIFTTNKDLPNLHFYASRSRTARARSGAARWAQAGRRTEARTESADPASFARCFSPSASSHVTLKVRAEIPSLRTVDLVREIERSFAAGCERPGFRLVHYSIQGNHTHLIVEADDETALGRGMKALGTRLAKAVNRIFGRSGPVLADRYHVHVLRTPREVRNALAYLLLNARRHGARAGRVLSRGFGIDPASSGRRFDGWQNAIGAAGPSPVAPARSWLLTVGWRRCGLLAADEIPGRS